MTAGFESGRVAAAGTTTFWFADMEGSTRLLQQLGDAWAGVLDRYLSVIRAAVVAGGGTEVNTEGDGVFAAFPTAVEPLCMRSSQCGWPDIWV